MCLAVVLVAALVAGLTAWGAGFLWLANVPSPPLRAAMAIVFVIGTLASFALLKHRWRTVAGFLVVCAALLVWYYSISPSNDRRWAPEVAVLPTATVNGNLVEVQNIRNFDYRTATDFTPRYYDKTFDLDTLQSVDLISVHWGSPAIAHLMISFGFGDDDFVTFSIEMRKEKGEAGSMLRSLFRKYELTYVVADERDVIRVRRYNTLEDNCTTGVLERTHAYKGRARYNWKVLASGYAAEYAYELEMLDTSMPFAELRERCLVNAKAELVDQADDFSVRIRDGIPMPEPYTMEEFLNPP
jgi:hypothetical protein